MIKAKQVTGWARGCAMLSALVLMAGCSVLPKAESEVVYELPELGVITQVAVTPPASRWSLRVLTPHSNRMVNSTRILVLPDGNEVSVYKGVRWSDPAPILLRNRLVNAFRGQAQIGAVSNDSSNLTADVELGSDLNRFQVVYLNGVPTVDMQIDVFLVNPSDSNIIATKRFSVEQPVDGKEVPAVVQAFGKATDRLAADIVAWALQYSSSEVKGR